MPVKLDGHTDPVVDFVIAAQQFRAEDAALLNNHLACTRLRPAFSDLEAEGVLLTGGDPISKGNRRIQAAMSDIEAFGGYHHRLNPVFDDGVDVHHADFASEASTGSLATFVVAHRNRRLRYQARPHGAGQFLGGLKSWDVGYAGRGE